MSARLLLFMVGILAGSVGRAGPLSMEPSLGLASEYSSNPYLLTAGGRAVNDVAVLLDAPTRYDLDSAQYALVPSIRYSDSGGGYASLASDYFHLNASAAFSSDLDRLSLTAAAARDSSLYQNGLSNNGIGVRSDSGLAGAEWLRTLTERSQIDLSAGWTRVLYNQNATTSGLVDYRYLSAGAALIYFVSERDKAQLSAGAGQYVALDGITRSRNDSLQIGLERKLSEIWTLSMNLGYAKSNNSEKLYEGPFFLGGVEFGPYYLGTINSEQKGPVYSASLTHRGELLSATATASRSFHPNGFEFLSRTDLAELDLDYTYSERWKFAAKATYQNTATPGPGGDLSTVRYVSAFLSAGWHWTERWMISLDTTWTSVKYVIPPIGAQSTGVSLKISRQFSRIDL